ncbi:MAG: hypothetical protein L0219_09595 [Phycisphaerales bacterium]|nr:hypothetical protein [Phycisphaerales bacterium]
MSDKVMRTNLRVALLLVAGAGLAIPASLAQTRSEPPSGKSAAPTRQHMTRSVAPITIKHHQANPARARAASTGGQNDGGIQGANPACGVASGNPDCCVASPGIPGCQDDVCCNMICDCDPYCCSVMWDAFCAGTGFVPGCGAALLCEQCLQGPCDPPTPNDDCVNATDGGLLNPGGSVVFAGTMNCATFDCPLLTAGTGEAWARFELTAASPVRISYCGSTGVWGNAYIVFTGACPCDALTFFSSFAFDCADGNVRIMWNDLPAGVWYYPILHDPVFGATGDYVITVQALQIDCGDGVCDAPLETCSNCPHDCDPPSVCGAAGHDCTTVGGPGCDDPTCCCTVCSIDPFCCDVAWDRICANEADAIGCGCEFCSGNGDCDEAFAIGEVCQMSFWHVSTTDGPPHAACDDGAGNQQVDEDIWYDYTASCTGDVTVSLCGTEYDTELAVYDGCTCELSDANLIGCDDDSCGLQSSITFAAAAGACYKIRVGRNGGPLFGNQLTISNTGFPCSSCPSDLNSDGVTDVLDLLNLIGNWGPCDPCPSVCPSDLNHDGVTNVTDLLQLIGNWGACE